MRIYTKKKFLLLASILAVALLMTTSASEVEAEGDELVIIANKSIKASSISAGELKAIFLKKKGTFKGGKVIPINARDGSSLRKQFRKSILSMDGNEEAAYWEELKVRKGGTSPTEFGTTLKAVFSVKGSIGYCRKSQFKEGVVKLLKLK